MCKLWDKNNLAYLAIDILLLACSTYAAFLLRLGSDMEYFQPQLYRMLPVILIIKISSLSLFGLYRGREHMASNLYIIRGCIMATLIMFTFVLLGVILKGVPRSIFVLDCCFTIISIAGYRFGIHRYQESTVTVSKRPILTEGSSVLCVLWLVACLAIEWRLSGMPGVGSKFLPSWEIFLQWMFF
jgi:FlaA1/EpsC-like NDP-sugar epimerase